MEILSLIKNLKNSISKNGFSGISKSRMLSVLDECLSIAQSGLSNKSLANKTLILSKQLSKVNQDYEDLQGDFLKFKKENQELAYLKPFFEKSKKEICGKISLLNISDRKKNFYRDSINSADPEKFLSIRADIQDIYSQQFKNPFLNDKISVDEHFLNVKPFKTGV